MSLASVMATKKSGSLLTGHPQEHPGNRTEQGWGGVSFILFLLLCE